jgi:hypothetical protein
MTVLAQPEKAISFIETTLRQDSYQAINPFIELRIRQSP